MKQFLLFILFIPFSLFSQGKLKKAKESLKQKSTTVSTINANTTKSSPNVRKSRRNSSREASNIEHQFHSLLIEIGFYATVGIVFGRAQERDLNPYPYFYDDEGEYAKVLSETGQKQNLRLGANYLFNNVKGFELNAIYKPIPIIGVDASYLRFSEKNLTTKESLDITSLQLNYHRFREKNFTIWWGAGITYVGNEIDKIGFAYNFGTEIYPFKPISLHISWKESFVNGNDIGVFKSQIKYHIKNKTFFTGYHNYKIGSESISGPVFGFELTL